MGTPTNDPEKPLVVAQVDAWISTMVGKHAELYRYLLEAEHTTERELVFLEISRLLHEAIEEVRVLGANLREHSTVLHERTTELLEHSQRLRDRHKPYQGR